MEEFKGTNNGKWMADGYIVYEDYGIQGHICELTNFYNDKKTLANAHLIAAAPDLLKSLQSLYNAIDSCVDLTPEVLQQAKDAINKALNINQ